MKQLVDVKERMTFTVAEPAASPEEALFGPGAQVADPEAECERKEKAVDTAAWWRRTRPRRQQARVVTGRGLSISFQNIEGETIRLEPRLFERDPHSFEVAMHGTFAPYAPSPDRLGVFNVVADRATEDSVDTDNQGWLARAREAFVSSIAAVFGVSRDMIVNNADTEPPEAPSQFPGLNMVANPSIGNPRTPFEAEITRVAHEDMRRLASDAEVIFHDPLPHPWQRDYQLDQMSRSACRILGLPSADADLATIDGKLRLIQGARRQVAAYGVSYRAPDAWCMGSRWRPLTGYGGGRSMPTRAQIEALPARFRDVCGE